MPSVRARCTRTHLKFTSGANRHRGKVLVPQHDRPDDRIDGEEAVFFSLLPYPTHESRVRATQYRHRIITLDHSTQQDGTSTTDPRGILGLLALPGQDGPRPGLEQGRHRRERVSRR